MGWSILCVCQETHPVCLKSISDPHFATIYHIVIAFSYSFGLDIYAHKGKKWVCNVKNPTIWSDGAKRVDLMNGPWSSSCHSGPMVLDSDRSTWQLGPIYWVPFMKLQYSMIMWLQSLLTSHMHLATGGTWQLALENGSHLQVNVAGKCEPFPQANHVIAISTSKVKVEASQEASSSLL